MGLDMYLYASVYVSKIQKNGTEKIKAISNIIGVENTEPMEVSFQIGYWRKANAIHGWFVNNVQEGVDNCLRHYVSREQLEELKEICLEVKKDPSNADELLPTTTGFFFGSIEYDDYYFEDIDLTLQIIEGALDLIDKGFDIYYRSSW